MTTIHPADLRRLVLDRSVASPGDREVLADALDDLGRSDMAGAVRAGRPWRTFLGATVIAVQPESDRRSPTLGTWIDGVPIQWSREEDAGACWYVTAGEARDERPTDMRWETADEAAILARRDALLLSAADADRPFEE